METRNIVGSYYPVDSAIHRLDSRVKFLCLIIFVVMIFLFSGVEGYIYLTITLFTIFAISKLPISTLWKIFKTILIMFAVLFIVNFFIAHPSYDVPFPYGITLERAWTHEEKYLIFKFYKDNGAGYWHEWFYFPLFKIHIWDQSLWRSLYIIWRIYLMMLATFLLTSTTKPLDLTLALEDLLKPLNKVKVPVHSIAMMTSISLRFIPTVLEEASRISKAQASRGSDIKNGNMKQKVKGLIALIIPLFVSAFQKAEDLANAMDARGYNPYAKRTRFHNLKMRFTDWMCLILWIGLLILIVFTFLAFTGNHPFFNNFNWFSILNIGEPKF